LTLARSLCQTPRPRDFVPHLSESPSTPPTDAHVFDQGDLAMRQAADPTRKGLDTLTTLDPLAARRDRRPRVARSLRIAGATAAALLLMLYRPAAHAQQPQPINGILAIPADDFSVDGADDGDASVKGGVGLRSQGGQLARRLQLAIQHGALPQPGGNTSGHSNAGKSGHGAVDGNVQVNDPDLDHVTTFDPALVKTRPFEFATESETSLVANGQHIVVGYNSSAGAVVQFFPGAGLFFTQLLFSGYSVSHDGGSTWASGFVPPISPSVPFTFGDPSLAIDRGGNIFYASLGTDATGAHNGLIINKSTDNGTTWAPAKVVVVDDGSDKEWLAIGPDPSVPARDNLYITWTSFAADGSSSQLRLARSTDGGATWSTKTLFAPVDDHVNSSFVTFSNPTVDASTGRLYVPFLHFSDGNADNVRVLVSDDGGQTFHFLAFNVPGAVDAFAYPNVTPGALNDCGDGGFRNVLHQGPSAGAGRFGTFRYIQTTRLVTQPAAAAARGRLLIALQTSTSPFFGDPGAGSEINVLFSDDGGASWAPPLRVAPSTDADPQHVHPAIALGQNGNRPWVAYYVQAANGQLRTDIATLHVDGNHLKLQATSGLSNAPFDLTPNNIPFPSATNAFRTTNFDRAVATCYDIGEYMSIGVADDPNDPIAAWGDNRNLWIGPPGSPAPGPHAQPDVFSGRVTKK
jgi:hypothetical protein